MAWRGAAAAGVAVGLAAGLALGAALARRQGATAVASSCRGGVATTTSGDGGKGNEQDGGPVPDAPDQPLRRLRRVEAALRDRIGRVAVVLERTANSHNFAAVLRTAEGLGFQHIYVVSVLPEVQRLEAPRKRGSAPPTSNTKRVPAWEEDDAQYDLHVGVGRGATKWLTLHVFEKTHDAIAALRRDGYDIWVTDLSQRAKPLGVRGSTSGLVVPPKLAFVMGTEGAGVSQAFVDAADERVFLPQSGFADSFNISVAAAMMMQQLLFMAPEIVGSLPEPEKRALREQWYLEMARNEEERAEFLALLDNPPPAFTDTRRHDSHRTPRMRPSDVKKMVDGESYQPGR